MIVTFHMTVYFAYTIWNKYVSNYIFGVGHSNENRDDGPRPVGNNLETRPANERNDASSSGAVLQNQPETLSVHHPSDSGSNDVEKRKVMKEATQILQNIEFEDKQDGLNIIYDTEPEYYSIFTPEGNGIKFIPPVYLQRYVVVDKMFRGTSKIEKVIEFGCAELTFMFKYLKRTSEIREIVGVDIDKELLERHMIKLSPTATDYLKRRANPLNIKVFRGSVADTNVCLLNADAVIGIELIEHLFPPELERLPFTVFGFIKPKLAIFTTPNVDFNVLFGNPEMKFRHDDHKFEWSRQQFQDWGNNIVECYPDYSVTFHGIGPGPEGTEKYGHCSQMAVFVKQTETASANPNDLNIQDGTYDLLVEYEYPYDERSEDQKIRDEAVGFLNRCDTMRRMYCSDDDETEDMSANREILLEDVMARINCFDKEKVKNILSAEKWETKKNCEGNEVVVLPNCEDFEESFSDYDEYDRLHKEDNEDTDHLTPNPVTVDDEEIWECNHQHEPCGSHLEYFNSVCMYSHEKVVSNANINDSDQKNYTNVKALNCDLLLSSHSESVPLPNDVVPEVPSTSLKNNVALEQTNLNLSVYETPCFNGHTIKKQSPSSSGLGLKKKLSFDEDNLLGENQSMCNSSEYQSTPSSANNAFDSVSIGYSSSPCEVSVYSTPCASESHRKNVPKSFSLQQIENSSVSKVKEYFNDKMYNFSDEEVKQVSRSLEGLKNEGSFEICKSFPSLSRVIDSGYPDSNSEQEMDLDLTLEQFDEIESLSDNESNSLPSPVHPVANFPHLIDDVENGDVANNNRDGEGNNLVADMDEEPLEFEAQIQVDNEVQNFDGANADMDIEPMDYISQIEDCDVNYSDGFSEDAIDEHKGLVSNKVSFVNEEYQRVPNKNSSTLKSRIGTGCDEDCLEPTPSVSSIATTCSWNCEEPANVRVSRNTTNSFKTQNSLTTVLDGCSTFSECSLVKPLDTSQKSGKTPTSSDCFELDNLSIKSIYESTESLASNISETIEQSPFPKWLLDLPVDDDNVYPSISEGSISSTDSYHNIAQHITVTVPLDPRGGGDPQSYSLS